MVFLVQMIYRLSIRVSIEIVCPPSLHQLAFLMGGCYNLSVMVITDRLSDEKVSMIRKATITHRRPTHGTLRKRHRTLTAT